MKLKTRDVRAKFGISPDKLDSNIENTIKEKVESLLQGKENMKIGYVMSIDEIKEIENAIMPFSEAIPQFNVLVTISYYYPKVGEVFSSTVKKITEHGYYLNEYIETFVGTKTKLDVDSEIKVKIIKISSNEGKFIVLTKEII